MSTPVLDLLGVGFGPANLGLAIAAAEHSSPPSVRFVERQAEFGWHRGMLLPDARMQIPFVKDLATVRNPSSSFSFLGYLAEKGRLVDFLNRQTFFPARLEFHDYLRWAAHRFDDVVDYGTEVVEIAAGDDADGPLWQVVARTNAGIVEYRARTVVIATGLTPHLPAGVCQSGRTWHSSRLVPMAERFATGRPPQRFVVVGAGQSAAEAVDFLHGRFPSAEVHAVLNYWGFPLADDSAFANRVFDPDAAHEFHRSPAGVRRSIIERHRNTNYSVVDSDLIERIYEKHYAELVSGTRRLHFHPMSGVARVDDTGARLTLTVESGVRGTSTSMDADGLVYATGYRSGDPTRFLGGVAPVRDDRGQVRIGADYRVEFAGSVAPLYVQGATEHTHGLASTLLSNIAVRTGEILESIVRHRDAGPTAVAVGAGAGERRAVPC